MTVYSFDQIIDLHQIHRIQIPSKWRKQLEADGGGENKKIQYDNK